MGAVPYSAVRQHRKAKPDLRIDSVQRAVDFLVDAFNQAAVLLTEIT